jgi:hypothetical protein
MKRNAASQMKFGEKAWRSSAGERLPSFAITTSPNELRAELDDPMPAILRPAEGLKERAVVEHDIADGLADRLEAARQRALAQMQGTVPRPPLTLPRLVDNSGD